MVFASLQPSFATGFDCLQWSEDNQIAVALHDQTLTGPEVHQMRIACNRDHIEQIKLKASEGFRRVAWSPSKLSAYHGCYLAIMTRFGRIILQKPTPAGEYDEFRVYEEESSKYTPSVISWSPWLSDYNLCLFVYADKGGKLIIDAFDSASGDVVSSGTFNVRARSFVTSICWLPHPRGGDLIGVLGFSDGSVSIWRFVVTDAEVMRVEEIAPLCAASGVPVELIRFNGGDESWRIFVAHSGKIRVYDFDAATLAVWERSPIDLPCSYLVSSLAIEPRLGKQVHVATQDGRILVYTLDGDEWNLDAKITSVYRHHFQTSELQDKLVGEDDEENEDGMAVMDQDQLNDIFLPVINSKSKSPVPVGMQLSPNGVIAALAYGFHSPLDLYYDSDAIRKTAVCLVPVVDPESRFLIDAEHMRKFESSTAVWDIGSLDARFDEERINLTDYMNASWLGSLMKQFCQHEDNENHLMEVERYLLGLAQFIPEKVVGRSRVLAQLRLRILRHGILAGLEAFCNTEGANVSDVTSLFLKIQYGLMYCPGDLNVLTACATALDCIEQSGLDAADDEKSEFCRAARRTLDSQFQATGGSVWRSLLEIITIPQIALKMEDHPALTFPAIETCTLCDSKVMFKELEGTRCGSGEGKGHRWSRCFKSFKILVDPFQIGVCPTCDCKMSMHASATSTPVRCVFCGCKIKSLMQV